MCRISLVVLTLLGGFLPASSWAGAWTQDRGHIQIISGVTVSRAVRNFDQTGKPKQKILFNKVLTQNCVEYGLTNAVTLFIAPEYVSAQSNMSGGAHVTQTRNVAVEGGARILLLTRIGMVSLQSSVKTAGAFDMSVSANGASGRQAELRVLYGRNFKLFGVDGFADLQVAERWISRPRPNEMTIDATAGLWVRRSTLIMIQNFNTVSGGGGLAPYTFYRSHKIELSLVQRITRTWSLQLGGIFSPVGRNTIMEQGISAAIWYRV